MHYPFNQLEQFALQHNEAGTGSRTLRWLPRGRPSRPVSVECQGVRGKKRSSINKCTELNHYILTGGQALLYLEP